MAITLDEEYKAFKSLLENGIPEPSLRVLSHTPLEPKTNEVVFSLDRGTIEEENRAIVVKSRSYQLLFYVDDKYEAMQLHSNIEALLLGTTSIPCANRYIKVKSFAVSRIFAIESGKESFVCMIEGEYREARTFTKPELMADINARVQK